jgi:uncharacterized membrane protein YkoI
MSMVSELNLRHGAVVSGLVFVLLSGLGAAVALAKPSAIELEIMQNARLDLAGAIERAERDVGGQVIEAELDEDDDMYFYRVEVVGPEGLTVLYLNPATGVTVGRRDPGLRTGTAGSKDQDLADAVAKSPGALIRALRAAEQQTGGKAIEIEVERDDGDYVLEIKTIQPGLEHELEIDLASGRVLDIDVDD